MRRSACLRTSTANLSYTNLPGDGGGNVETQIDTIFVAGMDTDITEDEIEHHFGAIGIIKKDKKTQKPKIWIYRDKATGQGKGECTITFDDPHTASSAIDWFDGKDFKGATIKVSLAQRTNTWAAKKGGGGGGGRGFGGGGGRFGGDDRGPRGGGDDRRGKMMNEIVEIFFKLIIKHLNRRRRWWWIEPRR